MIKRHISPAVESLALLRHKMAFVSGPRQCGKTTLAKSLIQDKSLYYNWDQLKFRQLWVKHPEELAEHALKTKDARLVLDEIHKNRKWKGELKGFFDEYGDKLEILVTGSARLNTYRKGGDSLLGRFYHFHLYPLSLCELLGKTAAPLPIIKQRITGKETWPSGNHIKEVENLLRFGGFPEPLLSGKEEIHTLWQRNRLELLIRQDLRDLSRINEISQVEVLASLLPLKVGSPLSFESLREDLEVAFTTVQKWLALLEALYYQFNVKPYAKSIIRSLKKEGKTYLFDWSSVEEKGPRFENMVASHLLKFCDYFNDIGAARLELYYLRNKEKKEVDFLIVYDKKPWFTLEAKLGDLQLDRGYQIFQKQLHIPHFQIVLPSGINREYSEPTGKARVLSFDRFFMGLG